MLFLKISKRIQYIGVVVKSIKKYFEGCFGITREDKKVENIRIQANWQQAKYIYSGHLHQSLTIIQETKNYTDFQWKIRPSYDLIQKLLSYGSRIEILTPESLRKDFQTESVKFFKKYH